MGECWMSITIPHKGFCASQREHFDHPWPSISAVERTCEWNAVLPRSLINETYCNTAIFERHLLSGLQVYEKDIRHLLGWRSVTVTVFQRLSDTNVNVAFSGTVSELKRFLCLEDFVHTKFRKCLFVLFKLEFWCLNLISDSNNWNLSISTLNQLHHLPSKLVGWKNPQWKQSWRCRTPHWQRGEV